MLLAFHPHSFLVSAMPAKEGKALRSVTVTINGLTASGKEGMSILDLAREMGISIPTLCHDPHLEPFGACRICLVEEEKTGTLLASCVAPISPGMEIRTDSPRVLETRRMVLKLMLASHPESCLLCDKGNRCQLRQIAAALDIGLMDLFKLPHYTGIQELNPFIRRDLSKCILCGKCIRADQELVGIGAIDYFHRGLEAKPATLMDRPLEGSECTFCGTCVDLCPTGALSTPERFSISTPGHRVPSVCPLCACGCAISLGMNCQGLVEEVKAGSSRDSVNQATLCVKGRYGWEFTASPNRLTKPLIRKNGILEECSWNEALDFVVHHLQRIRNQAGPEALAFLGSSQCTNEENYLFQKLARAGIGTNNIDHSRRHSFQGVASAWERKFGWGTATRPIADLEETRCILVIGANPDETAPVLAYAIRRAVRRKGAQLILVDPRRIPLAPLASPWLRPRWGTDGALILGLIRTILDELRGSLDGVEENVEGLDEFLEEMLSFDLGWAEQVTGVPQEEIRKCGRDLATHRPLAIVFGNGILSGSDQGASLRSLMNLCLLTGSFGAQGGGFYPLGKDGNGQGACDMGSLPGLLPGYQDLDDEKVRKIFEAVWGRPVPRPKGLNGWEMFCAAHDHRIKGMFLMGENPLRSLPDAAYVQKALAGLDFLVCQDLFLTETARLAQVVLPASSFTEKTGTVTSMERRVQRFLAAQTPRGESQPDWKILTEILNRLGLAPAYKSPEEILEEINRLVPLYGGITFKRLSKGGLHWPCLDPNDPGRPCLWPQGISGERPRFLPVTLGDWAEEKKRAEGSFQLILGSTLFNFGRGTRSSQSPRLVRHFGPRGLRMNAVDAKRLGVAEGSPIKVFLERGQKGFPVHLDPDLPPGALFLPISPGEESVFGLLPFVEEEKGGWPVPKRIAVKIERTEGHGRIED